MIGLLSSIRRPTTRSNGLVLVAMFIAVFAATPAWAQVSTEGKDESTDIRKETDRKVTAAFSRDIHRVIRGRVRRIQGGGAPLRFGGMPEAVTVAGNSSNLGFMTGLSAGSVVENITAWVDAGFTATDSDAAGVVAKTDILSLTIGADHPLGDRLLVGLSGGLTSTEGQASFSSAFTNLSSDNRSDVWTVAPYFAYILSDNIYADLSFGFERTRSATRTFNRATGITTISFGRDSNTYFVGANLNYTDTIEGFIVAANVGHNRSVTRASSFATDQGGTGPSNDNLVSQLIVGGEVGRPMGMVTPYVHLAYEYDLRKAPRGGGVALVGSPTAETDRHALRWGFGLDANLSERLVGTLEFSSVTVKDNYDEVTFLANLNWAF